MDTASEHKLTIRNLQLSDFPGVREIMDRVYADMGGSWTPEQFETLITRFPQGQLCVEDKGTVAAAALTLTVQSSKLEGDHSYQDIVRDRFRAHDPTGDYLYGIDLFVHPDYRSMRLGRRLYDARKELCEELNLKGILVGGRIPGYAAHAAELSPKEYIERVKRKEIADLDLDLLKELREQGSVRTVHNRRTDLYSVQWHKPSS